MKTLLLGTALATLAFAGAANAVQIGNLVITEIDPESTGTFDNDALGAQSGSSTVSDWAYNGQITFFTDGAVAQGLTGSSAPPWNDTSRYLYGANLANGVTYTWSGSKDPVVLYGAVVSFYSYAPTSFNIYWGSIDATSDNDNTLTVYLAGAGGIDIVTGEELVAAFGVDGFGAQTGGADSRWFNVSDLRYDSDAGGNVPQQIVGFTASSTQNAFEFDMAAPEAVPEPSTWAMMGLGFAGLAFAGYRARRTAISIA